MPPLHRGLGICGILVEKGFIEEAHKAYEELGVSVSEHIWFTRATLMGPVCIALPGRTSTSTSATEWWSHNSPHWSNGTA